MEKFSLKNLLKKINTDELIFDILLLIIANAVSFFFVNEKLLFFEENTDPYLIASVICILIFILFINVGEMIGRYKKHDKIKRMKIVFVVFMLITVFSLFMITEDILEDVDRYLMKLFPFISLIFMILGFLLGYYSKVKSFKKSMKLSGIIAFILMTVALSLFILNALDRNNFDNSYAIIGGVALILGIVFFLILPSRFASFVLKRENVKKSIIYVFLILSVVIFSLWDFTVNEYFTYEEYPGYIKKNEMFFIAYLPLISYRFLMAAAPPKNTLNMIIGIAVLVFLILF